MAVSPILDFVISIPLTTIRNVRVINRSGFDALLILFPAVTSRVYFRSRLGHQIGQSQPAAAQALVDPDVNCLKTQADIARNASAEVHRRLMLVDVIAMRYRLAD